MTKIFLILLIAFLMTNCKTGAPSRVKGIPETAFWAGGEDGGQWYLVDSVNKSNQTINCKIYNDYSGELVIDKKFKLHCVGSDTDIKWDNLKEEFNAYDGTTIYLKTIDGYGKYCSFK